MIAAFVSFFKGMNIIDIEVIILNSCEFVTFISTIACSIAKCVDKDELALIGAALAQLGDTITTMAVRDELCSRKTNSTD